MAIKKLLWVICFGIILLNSISLAYAFGETAFFNTSDGDYGSYDIVGGWGILPTWLGGSNKAWIQLTKNTEQCLIDCSAEGKGYFYASHSLFDELTFTNRLNKAEMNLKNLKIRIGQLKNITKQTPIYKEVCKDTTITNLTSTVYTDCHNELTGYKDSIVEEMVWKVYQGENIIGYFEWEIKAQKDKATEVDWVITIWGEKLDAWAWWNSNWLAKKPLTLIDPLATDVEREEYVEADFTSIAITTNCSDEFRLLNSSETGEIVFDVISENATRCEVGFVINKTAGSDLIIYGYYNNTAATNPGYTTDLALIGNDTTKCFINNTYYNATAENTATVGDNSFGLNNLYPNIPVATYDNQYFSFEGGTITTNKCIVLFDGVVKKKIQYGQDANNIHVNVTFYAGTKYFKYQVSNFSTTDSGVFLRGELGAVAKKTMVRNDTSGDYHTYISDQSNINFENYGMLGVGQFTSTVLAFNMINDSTQKDRTVWGYLRGGGSPEDALWSIEATAHLNFNGNMNAYADHYGGVVENTTDSLEGMYRGRTTPLIYTLGAEEVQGATVNLISPVDGLESTDINQTLHCNATFDSDIANLSLIINNAYNYTNSTVGNYTDIELPLNFADGQYNWTCDAVTVGLQTTRPNPRNMTIHTVAPQNIILEPRGTTDYHLVGNNLTMTWNITEAGQNMTTHIINCTYDYNGNTIELNNTVCTVVNQTTLIYSTGVNNLVMNITDEFNIINISTTSWNFKLIEHNQTFSNETTEGNLEDFLATIELLNPLTISIATLTYNGTGYVGQSFTVGNLTFLRKVNLPIPNIDMNDNLSFHWNVTLSDGTDINLSFYNQSVYNMTLDNCTVYSNVLFNFTMYDEELQTLLPSTSANNITNMEIAVDLYSSDRSILLLNISANYQKNPTAICLSRNLTASSNYSIDVIVRYTAITYADEYYNIVDFLLTNNTLQQNINLYSLNASDSTDFQLTFTGTDFLPVENALVYVERQYIAENVFKVVELPKTDSNGQTILHLVRNDIIYNIRILKDKEVLGNFENLIAFCEDFTIGDCKINLDGAASTEEIFDYDSDIGIIFGDPVYNNATSQVGFNFLTADGSVQTVTMEITSDNIFGNNSICNTSLTSSGGTLLCNIDPNLDETTLRISVYSGSEIIAASRVRLDPSNYGAAGYLIFLVMALAFVLMFSGSKSGILFGMVLSFVTAIGLGILTSNLIGIGASGLWLLIMVVIGIWKLNKTRVQ